MAGPPPTLLLVDDEPDLLESLRALLAEDLGGALRVVTATSGKEALDRMREGRGPDLIVTDYRMPGMNGIEFLQEAEKIKPGVPRLMITAYSEPKLAAAAAREAGVVLMIAKPFDLDYFVAVVRAIAERDASP